VRFNNYYFRRKIISSVLPITKMIWSYKVFFASFVGQESGPIQQNAIKAFVERVF
jgi:hypothetical protein